MYLTKSFYKAKNVCKKLGDGWRLPTLEEGKINKFPTDNKLAWTSTIKNYMGDYYFTFFKNVNNKVSTKALWIRGGYHFDLPIICIKKIN